MACAKQQEIKSSTRENDAIERRSKHEMCEAIAGVMAYGRLFIISRKSLL